MVYCFAFNFTLRILALARDYAFKKNFSRAIACPTAGKDLLDLEDIYAEGNTICRFPCQNFDLIWAIAF